MSTDTQLKADAADAAKTLAEFRDALQSVEDRTKGLDPEKLASKEAIVKLEAKAFALEEQGQKYLASKVAGEKAYELLAERLDVAEKRYSRSNSSAGDNLKLGMKTLDAFLCKGAEGMKSLEHKTMRTDINTDGGFLTTDPEILEGIIKDITEISPIRELARVRPTSTESLKVRRRSSLFNSVWKGQLETAVTDNSKYGMMEIPVNKLPINVDVSREMLLYEDVSIVNEIMQDFAEDSAENEGFAFVLGDGVKKPEGFLVNADVVAAAITSASSAVVDGDDFATLATSLKVGYTPVFGFNRTTWGQVINLKDSTGQYLINQGDLSKGISATIRGIPYRVIQDMPDVAAGALAVVCADFNKGYVVADGLRLEVIRDEFSRKKEGVIEFLLTTYVGGQVVQPEAFAVLAIKA